MQGKGVGAWFRMQGLGSVHCGGGGVQFRSRVLVQPITGQGSRNIVQIQMQSLGCLDAGFGFDVCILKHQFPCISLEGCPVLLSVKEILLNKTFKIFV